MIILEGMEGSFQLLLYHSQAFGFSTYIVDDMVVEEASSGEGDAMIVFANFAGKRNRMPKFRYFPKGRVRIRQQKDRMSLRGRL
ncbi:hypothetical protein ACQKOM_06040 [Peribacillus frigoritolerans]|uniref:hypothetical protein n=1 Tax=Peribacillus frigoritolerans TaxID=450367 RepID=UPI003CFF80DF